MWASQREQELGPLRHGDAFGQISHRPAQESGRARGRSPDISLKGFRGENTINVEQQDHISAPGHRVSDSEVAGPRQRQPTPV